jgi:hypothetical protein
MVTTKYQRAKLAQAQKVLPGTWAPRDVVRVLRITDTTANRWIIHWLNQKLVERVDKGRYCFRG